MIYGTFVEAFGQFSRQIQFLSKALGDKEIWPELLYILIEPSEKNEGKFKGLSSDGRRLHIVDPLACPDNVGIEPGSWRFLRATPDTAWIAKVTLKNDMPAFPNYKRVIPTEKPNFVTQCRFSMHDILYGSGILDVAKLINSFPALTAIKPTYLADLDLGHADLDLGDDDVWHIAWYEQNKAVVFESGSNKAIIMPLKSD